MQIANSPLKWTIAFANGDTGRVEVPATTADPTRASLTLGFPPLTRVPPEDGGVPPLGEDFNGAMNQVARIALWNMAGGVFSYDATFANDTNVSGYPQGAVLASTDFSGAWTTTVDNNAVDPDTTGTNWVPVYAYGVLALTGQTGGTTTLTPVQAMKKTITIAGALTSNLTVVVPAWTYNWQVSNLTTGAFTVTVKTAAGSGTIIPQTGTPTPVTGDGTNVASADYLRNDLAGTGAGKGGSLVGFLQQGTGALATSIKAGILGFFFTPQMFGAAGDDVADDTAAIQAWVNACALYGYKGWLPAVASGYKLTAQISIAAGFQIVGDGCEPLAGTGTFFNTRGRGSWFHIAHAGQGFSITGGVSAKSGVLIQGIGTYRDQPVPNGGAYTPGAFAYDFSCGSVDITFRDVMLYNPTNGISQTGGGYGRLTLENVRGQWLSVGINVDGSNDTGRVRGVHAWPFWTFDAGVKAYMLANGVTFQIARWDNPDIDACFCIGYKALFYVIQGATGTLNKAAISNCDSDNGGYLLLIDSSVTTGATIQMSNTRTRGISGGVPPANFANIQINGNNSRVILSNVELAYPQGACIRVQGTGNVVKASNLSVGAWNQANGSFRAIDANTSGNTITLNDLPIVTSAGFGGTSLLTEASGSTVTCPLTNGTATGTTSASGILTVTHGAPATPRHLLYANFTAGGLVGRPTGTYTATTFDIEVRNITAAGALQTNYGVTVDWRVSF